MGKRGFFLIMEGTMLSGDRQTSNWCFLLSCTDELRLKIVAVSFRLGKKLMYIWYVKY